MGAGNSGLHGAFSAPRPTVQAPLTCRASAAPADAAAAPPRQLLREHAEQELQEARQRLANAEAAAVASAGHQAAADAAKGLAAEAAQNAAAAAEDAAKALADAEAAVRGALLAAGVGGATGPVASLSEADLAALAAARLAAWRERNPQAANFQDAGTFSCRLSADAGLLTATLAAAEVDGRRYGIAAIAVCDSAAAGNASASGNGMQPTVAETGSDSASALAGVQLYWGCVQDQGQKWLPPPAGWHTDPGVSHPAGRAWRTPFGDFQQQQQQDDAGGPVAHAVLLQLPLDGPLQGGGVAAVLTRPPGQGEEWLKQGNGNDLFVDFGKASRALDGKGSADAGATQSQAAGQWLPCEAAPAAAQGSRIGSPANASPQERLAALAQQLEGAAESASSAVVDAAAAARAALAEAQAAAARQAEAEEAASLLHQEADELHRRAEEAAGGATGAVQSVQSATLAARAAAARLQGQAAEATTALLYQVAEERLRGWLQWADSHEELSGGGATNAQAPAAATVAQLEGLDGQLVALVAPCREGGRLTAVVAVAVAEAFPTGALDGAQLHWAAAPGPHRGWGGVPGGWQTEPADTRDAGHPALQTAMESVPLASLEPRLQKRPGAVLAATLQVPLEGLLQRGGIAAVLAAPGGRWYGCQEVGEPRSDFFLSTRQAAQHLQGQGF